MILSTITTRIISTVATVSALTFMVGRWVDQGFYSDSFLADNSITFEKRLDESDRTIASDSTASAFTPIYFPINDITQWRINGAWRVYRIVDAAKNSIEVENKAIDFKLIGNAKIELSNSNVDSMELPRQMQMLFISEYEKFQNRQTVVLFANTAEGIVTLEAERVMREVKVVDSIKVSNITSDAVTQNQNVDKKGLVVEEETTLSLYNAENPSAKKVWGQNAVYGYMNLRGGNIEEIKATIQDGNNEINIEATYSEIRDGGVLQLTVNGEDQAGIMVNNGKEGYVLRVGQTVLNFFTEEGFANQLSQVQETVQNGEQQEAREIAPELQAQLDEVNANANSEVQEREQVANETAIPEGFQFSQVE